MGVVKVWNAASTFRNSRDEVWKGVDIAGTVVKGVS